MRGSAQRRLAARPPLQKGAACPAWSRAFIVTAPACLCCLHRQVGAQVMLVKNLELGTSSQMLVRPRGQG